MNPAVAMQVAGAMVCRLSRGVTMRAAVESDRLVFLGGPKGAHSIDISVSTIERALAHWEGYCESGAGDDEVSKSRAKKAADRARVLLSGVFS